MEERIQPNSSNRLIGLDCFRIVAALITFLFHSVIHMGCNYGIFQEFFSMGAVFMTGFIMLSGYSLYYTYSQKDFTKIEDLKLFYKKRMIGILPGYYAVALVYFLGYANEYLLERVLLLPIDLLGVQTVYSSLFSVTHYGGTWFVSCILFCYLLFPFFVGIIRQLTLKEKRTILLVMIFLLLYSPIIVHFFGLSNIYSNPFFRLLEFLIGMLLASMQEELKNNKVIDRFFLNGKALFFESILLIVGITIAVKLQISVRNYMLYSWICLPIFCIMFPALESIKAKRSKVIAYASEVTYAFFLVQLFIWKIMYRLVEIFNVESNGLKIVLSIGVCTLIAVGIHELIEKPGKKIVKRILGCC